MSISSTKIKVYPSGYRGKNANNEIYNPEARLFNEENLTRSVVNLADYNEGSFVISKSKTETPFKFVINGYYFESTDDLATLLTNASIQSGKAYACVVISPQGEPSADNTDFLVRILKPADGVSQGCLDNGSYEFIGLKFASTAETEYSLLLYDFDEDEIPDSSFLKFNAENINGGSNKPLNKYLETKDISTDYINVQTEATIESLDVQELDVEELTSNIIPDETATYTLGAQGKSFLKVFTKDLKVNDKITSSDIETSTFKSTNAETDALKVNNSVELGANVQLDVGKVKLNTATDHFRINCGSAVNNEYLSVVKSTKSLAIKGLKTYLEDSKLFIEGEDPIKFGTASDSDLASIMHYGYALNGNNTFIAPTSSVSERRDYLESFPIYHILPGCNDLPQDMNAAMFGVHMEAKITFNNEIESGASDYISKDDGFYIQPVFWDSTNNAWVWRSTAETDTSSALYFETNSFTYSGVLYRIH